MIFKRISLPSNETLGRLTMYKWLNREEYKRRFKPSHEQEIVKRTEKRERQSFRILICQCYYSGTQRKYQINLWIIV